jgi:hypothetical protein
VEKITTDNDLAVHGLHIEELAWMKAKDKALGKFAPLGVWFDYQRGWNTFFGMGSLSAGNSSPV